MANYIVTIHTNIHFGVKILVKKVCFVFLSIFVFIICSNPLSTFAQTENQQQYYNQPIEKETSINEIENPFASMSIDELQSFVDSITNTSYNTDIKSSSSILSFPRPRPVISTSNGIWKLAWLAAAEIARQMGYPAAATLVEHSIGNNDYIEIEGYSGNTFFKEKSLKPTPTNHLLSLASLSMG